MRNIKLTLCYDGTDFHGWQRQQGPRTVQQVLEEALERLTGARTSTTASGRLSEFHPCEFPPNKICPLSLTFPVLKRRL